MLDVRRAWLTMLVPVLLAGCSDTNTLPSDTRLVAELGTRVDPGADTVGGSLEARLTGDLAAGDRVVLAEGTILVGRVTAVQARTDQLPWAVAISFDSVRIAGRAHPVPLEVTSVEARGPTGTDQGGARGAREGGGLVGEVVGGRSGAPLLQRSTLRAPGQAVVLGTRDEPAVLPAGGRIELRVAAPTELPAPGS